MFHHRLCSIQDCSNPVIGLSEVCSFHHPNPSEAFLSLFEENSQPWMFSNLNLAGIDLDHMTVPPAKWVGCNFAGSKFSHCSFEKSAFLLCMFEECAFYSCSFHETESLEVSYARTEFQDSILTNAKMVLSNFNGSLIQTTDLSQTDFTYSRFILSTLRKVLLRDANLRSVHFNGAILDQVDFTYSNTEDCVFD